MLVLQPPRLISTFCLIVIDITEEKNDLKVLINPEIVSASEELKPWEEGCLSFACIYDEKLKDRLRSLSELRI